MGLTGFGARGSHVFDDDDTEMWAVAGEVGIEMGTATTLDLTTAFVTFSGIEKLERPLWRQNLIREGRFVSEYDVLDVVAHLSHDGPIEFDLVVDACRNLGADQGRDGLWLALVVDGSTRVPGRFEYVYVWVDRDATLAAYPADDYLWTTGWEGHAVNLGARLSSHAAVHLIGQLQRYKDAPREPIRDDWVGRLRVELRLGL